jgi:hypothetical protein
MNDFFANWYELISYFEGFSDSMYDNSLYVPIGFCMVLIPIVFLTLYYYVVNSRRFNKWWHWLLLVVIICAINFGIAFGISYNGIYDIHGTDEVGYPLVASCIGFSFINVMWTALISFVWSMIIKWGSSQCRRTPF